MELAIILMGVLFVILLVLAVLVFIWRQTRFEPPRRAMVPRESTVTAILRSGGSLDHFFVKGAKLKLGQNGQETAMIDYGQTNETEFNEEVGSHIHSEIRGWLRQLIWPTGIYWISIFWPFRQVHVMEINARSLKPEADGMVGENGQVKDAGSISNLVTERTKTIWFLRLRFPRPVLTSDIELVDGVILRLLIGTKVRVVNPFIVMFQFVGDFFPSFDKAVESAIVSTFSNSNTTYPVWQKMQKGKGSELGKALNENLNTLTQNDKDTPVGLRRALGLEVEECWIVGYELSGDSAKIADAQRAKLLAEEEGKGTIAKAEAEARAIEILARAKGMDFHERIHALVQKGVAPNIAAEVVARIDQAENLKGVSTLVLGNSQTMLGIKEGEKNS